MSTKTTKTAKTAKTSLSPTLHTIPLREALECLTELERDFGVVPTAANALLADHTAAILSKADQINITSVAQLITHQQELLSALTGVKVVAAEHPTEVAETLHTYRNLVVAMSAAAAALNAPIEESGRAADAVYAQAVRLAARTTRGSRPCTDDEILLLRVHAALSSRRDPNAESANVYAMVDAGMSPMKATEIDLTSFDDPETPTVVRIPGDRRGGHSRYVPMDTFNQIVLGRRTRAALATGHPLTRPLAYSPRSNIPGTAAAAASSHRILDRVLIAAGLKNTDIKASSINRWRVHTIYTQEGIEAAALAYGVKSHERTLAAICAYNFDPEPTGADVTSFMSW